MLTELSVVEQRYLAVREALDGARITDVAVRYGVDRRRPGERAEMWHRYRSHFETRVPRLHIWPIGLWPTGLGPRIRFRVPSDVGV